MSRRQNGKAPCPLCGRVTRAHSQMVLADLEPIGKARRSTFATVICRDCAFAMVVRSEATALMGA